jgi:drug/metabolite transporter (DMT)-like permease
MMILIPAIIIFFATMIGAVGSLYLKKGAAGVNRNLFQQVKNYKVIFGFFLYFISSVIFIGTLRYGNVSILYPITSVSYIWISLLSIRYLGEVMNKLRWIGIFFIMLGVVLMTVV